MPVYTFSALFDLELSFCVSSNLGERGQSVALRFLKPRGTATRCRFVFPQTLGNGDKVSLCVSSNLGNGDKVSLSPQTCVVFRFSNFRAFEIDVILCTLNR